MKTLEHRAKKGRKHGESGEMADKKMDENREKRNGQEKGNTGLPSLCFLPPHANLGCLAYIE